MHSAWFTESKSVCWETTKVSKVVFSSLFFFHRITVKLSPRQLDLGALLANFLHKTNALQRVRHFFFDLPRRRFKPFFGSRDFFVFFCFRLFECCCVFLFFYFYFLLCFLICFMNLTVYVVVGNLFLFLVFILLEEFCLQNLFSCIIKDSY